MKRGRGSDRRYTSTTPTLFVKPHYPIFAILMDFRVVLSRQAFVQDGAAASTKAEVMPLAGCLDELA